MALFVRDGTLIAQLAVCEGSVDGLVVWHQETDSDDRVEVEDRRVEFESAGTGGHQVEIGRVPDDPSARWALVPGVDYGVLAGSRDNEWAITGPDFGLEDLLALQPNDLLASDSDGSAEVIRASPEEWARNECADW